jgi:Tfp pilus assembly protein PilO
MKPSAFYSRYYTYIKPVTKIPIVKTYGSIIFTFLVIIIFIFYAIKPTIETILVLQKKLTDSTTVLEQVNLKARNLSQGRTNLESMELSTRSKISQLIPDTVSLKSVVQNLEQTAISHQASISALQFQPLLIDTKDNDKPGALTPINFTFNVAGEYKNIILMLEDLKKSSRLISIDSLSITRSEDSALIMSLIGKAYYIK